METYEPRDWLRQQNRTRSLCQPTPPPPTPLFSWSVLGILFQDSVPLILPGPETLHFSEKPHDTVLEFKEITYETTYGRQGIIPHTTAILNPVDMYHTREGPWICLLTLGHDWRNLSTFFYGKPLELFLSIFFTQDDPLFSIRSHPWVCRGYQGSCCSMAQGDVLSKCLHVPPTFRGLLLNLHPIGPFWYG